MASLLNRGWRLIGTALGFTLFGVGGLLLSLLWFPLLALCLRGERRRTLAQLTIRHSFRLFLAMLRGWGVLDYRVSGMPADLQGALVVANHPSLLDYVILAAEMPVCDCIVKQSLWRNPFIGGVVRAADYLPNVAGEDLLTLCTARIRAGGLLLIFPEGTRTTPGEPIKLQRGAAQLAVRAQVPVQLVRIHCSARFLTKQDKWFKIPENKPTFTIEFLQQVAAQEVVATGQSSALAARQLTRFLTRALQPGPQ
ncbi:1-acyl-sn-glycerol-3-phosphate acyltransferase [Aeromonas taiwanensis]|uniref:1-acyl-sn-glycerol-3-phosphate acyltransferase n=1 Tax=Aeromonas taiwanensis TaxID=633417 RepID=A0A5F0K9X9_9GAMM|nr:lysophospholipid acyltransferase family protein [Aeromonas taiwanensis]TFF74321.1 1-acyl-sn-glycerol-3-phosphate acyltransferase [Aeromonas taiwanensis]TFF75112.1 1-acyl-sn-glycerol-3-phosphate acyltransferase [Aeromonas taiwanensis]TFF78538.1 1-acyl-sn-glycerol-3-phosphate acyltransferase [Aeromonas taiwanensis]